MNNEQLKIKQSVLKMVRKISGAAFSPNLNGSNIHFNLMSDSILIYAENDDVYMECFNLITGSSAVFSCIFPRTFIDIHDFEAEIEKALAEIFEYIRVNHE